MSGLSGHSAVGFRFSRSFQNDFRSFSGRLPTFFPDCCIGDAPLKFACMFANEEREIEAFDQLKAREKFFLKGVESCFRFSVFCKTAEPVAAWSELFEPGVGRSDDEFSAWIQKI